MLTYINCLLKHYLVTINYSIFYVLITNIHNLCMLYVVILCTVTKADSCELEHPTVRQYQPFLQY